MLKVKLGVSPVAVKDNSNKSGLFATVINNFCLYSIFSEGKQLKNI